MTTVKQMERQWDAKDHDKLLTEVLVARPDAAGFGVMKGAIPTAAMVLVRLDELNQGFIPFASKLTRLLLGAQEADGGWGDAMLTAVCLRALTAGGGTGVAIERGMNYLAMLQKPEGIWPSIPIRRTPGDATMSAFILMQLSGHESFRSTVRFADACRWFESHSSELDPVAKRLWGYLSARHPVRTLRRDCEPSLS